VRGRDQALEIDGLEEKKTGLFLVKDHEFDGDVSRCVLREVSALY